MIRADPIAVVAEELVHVDERDPRAIEQLRGDDPCQNLILPHRPNRYDQTRRPTCAVVFADHLRHFLGHGTVHSLWIPNNADLHGRPNAKLVAGNRHQGPDVHGTFPSSPHEGEENRWHLKPILSSNSPPRRMSRGLASGYWLLFFRLLSKNLNTVSLISIGLGSHSGPKAPCLPFFTLRSVTSTPAFLRASQSSSDCTMGTRGSWSPCTIKKGGSSLEM